MRSLAGSVAVLALLVSLFRAVGLTEHARAAEPDEIGAAQGRQTPSQPVSTDTICSALAEAAAQNDLPTDFFARLIWQESRFDPAAVSRAGAQGVAQFMPATANWRGLSNPFDPLEAIAESAKLLRDLRREFGNLGLAAAAYNAGSGRVRDWLAGRRALPRETSAYVRIVTGYSPEQWAGASAGIGEMRSEKPIPCGEIAAFVARTPPPTSKPLPVWGVELVGGPTDETALAAYRRAEQKYAAILGGRQTYVVHHGLGRGSMGWAHVHVGADDRPSAEKLCADLRGAGVSYCEVQHARSTR
jgi:catechol 2,3-dioxygenase-like lactoylglutathione lyase family enzyme